jgi:hypothetical protein
MLGQEYLKDSTERDELPDVRARPWLLALDPSLVAARPRTWG